MPFFILLNVYNGSKFFPIVLELVSLRVQNHNFRVVDMFRVDFKRRRCPSSRYSSVADAITGDSGTLERARKAQRWVGESRYSSTLSFNSALDGGGWSTPRAVRFTHGEGIRYPFYRRLVGTQGRAGEARKISLAPGFEPRTVQ